MFNEDSVNVVVEINTIEDEDPSIHTNPMKKTRVQKKHKKTSIIWIHFDELLSKYPNDTRIWAKCKFCDHKYIANNSHRTENPHKHMKNCGEKTEHDIQQLLIFGSQGNLSVSASKFCPKRYKELLIVVIIKHE